MESFSEDRDWWGGCCVLAGVASVVKRCQFLSHNKTYVSNYRLDSTDLNFSSKC